MVDNNFENLNESETDVKKSSLSQKAQTLKEIYEEQHKLEAIPLPERVKEKETKAPSYGE